MSGLLSLPARELLARYASGDASPVEAVREVAERTAALEGLGAFTTLCLDRAREEALASEAAYRRGEPQGPLAGLPLGCKDLYDSAGVRTTYGSTMFREHVPAADAEVLRRARAAGAILVGKTQTHEFAWGITSVNHGMGTSRNPWDPALVSGGSSGGSAVALATHQVSLALGSDTGGSIRVPASFCGIVGFKPTYGRVSLRGHLAAGPDARPSRPDDPHAGGRRAAARGHRRPRPGRSGDARRAARRPGRRAPAGARGHGGRPLPRPAPGAARAGRAAGVRRRRGRRARGGRRAPRGGAPRSARHPADVRRHAARRGPARPPRGRPVPGARGRVRRRRAQPARARGDRGCRRLPARGRRARASPRGAPPAVRGGRPAADAGRRMHGRRRSTSTGSITSASRATRAT